MGQEKCVVCCRLMLPKWMTGWQNVRSKLGSSDCSLILLAFMMFYYLYLLFLNLFPMFTIYILLRWNRKNRAEICRKRKHAAYRGNWCTDNLLHLFLPFIIPWVHPDIVKLQKLVNTLDFPHLFKKKKWISCYFTFPNVFPLAGEEICVPLTLRAILLIT